MPSITVIVAPTTDLPRTPPSLYPYPHQHWRDACEREAGRNTTAAATRRLTPRLTFDRLLYIDRLKEAGVDESVARAHAEALREALLETVATKADLKDTVQELNHKIDGVLAKIELTARDLTIRGAGALTIIVGLIVGLKLFG